MENAKPADETALIKRWVETWKFAGPELERIKRNELRALTEEAALKRLSSVMNSRVAGGWKNPGRRRLSGLVEQQQLFAQFVLPSK